MLGHRPENAQELEKRILEVHQFLETCLPVAPATLLGAQTGQPKSAGTM